jgi:transcriptional regulator with PAS, ATPase and Fis domain
LITVLSSYKATPVGSTDEYNVDCNFVFATNKNLLELVRNGLFMLDLYYRIVFTIIHTTSLASRPRDARLIAQAIIRHNGYDPLGEEEVVPITDGNVRTIEIWLYRRSLGLEGEALKRGITE